MGDALVEVPASAFWAGRSAVPGDPALADLLRRLRAGGANDDSATRAARRPAHLQREGGERTEKDFVALMNKLSNQNHEVIEAQLWRFFQPLLFTFYTNHLWALMYNQANFGSLYVAVLCRIRDRLPDDDQAKLRVLLRSLFDVYYRGLGASLPTMVLPPGEAYDEFCDAVKLKKQSVGKAAALSAMATAGLLDETLAGIVTRLGAIMPGTASPDVLAVWTDHVDAGLREVRWTPPQVLDLRSACERATKDPLPPKARFRMQDLVQLLASGPGAAASTAPHGPGPIAASAPHSRPSSSSHARQNTQHAHHPPQHVQHHGQHAQPSQPSQPGGAGPETDWREAKRRGGRGPPPNGGRGGRGPPNGGQGRCGGGRGGGRGSIQRKVEEAARGSVGHVGPVLGR